MPEDWGSTRVKTIWAAIVASTALPPSFNISIPALAASGFAAEIMNLAGAALLVEFVVGTKVQLPRINATLKIMAHRCCNELFDPVALDMISFILDSLPALED